MQYSIIQGSSGGAVVVHAFMAVAVGFVVLIGFVTAATVLEVLLTIEENSRNDSDSGAMLDTDAPQFDSRDEYEAWKRAKGPIPR